MKLRTEHRLLPRDEWRDGGVYGRVQRHDEATAYMPRDSDRPVLVVVYWPPRKQWINPDRIATVESTHA